MKVDRKVILAPSKGGKSYLAYQNKILDGDAIMSCHWGWPGHSRWPSVNGASWHNNPFAPDTLQEVCARFHWQLALVDPLLYPEISIESGREVWKSIYRLEESLPYQAWATIHMKVSPSCQAVVWLPGTNRHDAAETLSERSKQQRIAHSLGSKQSVERSLIQVDHFLAYAKRYHLPVKWGKDIWDDLEPFDLESLGQRIYVVPKEGK